LVGQFWNNDLRPILKGKQDAPPLRSGTKEEKVTENDRKDLLHWQQDIPLVDQMELFDLTYKQFKGQHREKQVHWLREHFKQSRGIW
jgi:hypothetical protein